MSGKIFNERTSYDQTDIDIGVKHDINIQTNNGAIFFTGSFVDCSVDCACCIDGKCGQGKWFPDECTFGCIDGYRGARCYEKCSFECTKCEMSNSKNCSACRDGYYPGPLFDCTSECLPNCKTCTSDSSCTSCKDEYYNDNGFNDCRYDKCPENSDQSTNMVIITLGIILAASFVANVILVVVFVVHRRRQR